MVAFALAEGGEVGIGGEGRGEDVGGFESAVHPGSPGNSGHKGSYDLTGRGFGLLGGFLLLANVLSVTGIVH